MRQAVAARPESAVQFQAEPASIGQERDIFHRLIECAAQYINPFGRNAGRGCNRARVFIGKCDKPDNRRFVGIALDHIG